MPYMDAMASSVWVRVCLKQILIYLPTFDWLFRLNVEKYTSPMDASWDSKPTTFANPIQHSNLLHQQKKRGWMSDISSPGVLQPLSSSKKP